MPSSTRGDACRTTCGACRATSRCTSIGKMIRIGPEGGFGSLETADNREIYFHKNSMVASPRCRSVPGWPSPRSRATRGRRRAQSGCWANTACGDGIGKGRVAERQPRLGAPAHASGPGVASRFNSGGLCPIRRNQSMRCCLISWIGCLVRSLPISPMIRRLHQNGTHHAGPRASVAGPP
jgi:hypothetical protein